MSAERLGHDPLDPHGDGTIRPGDPLWDMMMSGQAIHATRDPHDPTNWDVTRLPAIGGGDSGADRGDTDPPGDDLGRRRDYHESLDWARGFISVFVIAAILYIAVMTVIAVWMAVT